LGLSTKIQELREAYKDIGALSSGVTKKQVEQKTQSRAKFQLGGTEP